MVKNYMEEVVNQEIMKILKNYPQQCQCVRCINDMKAITLNDLPPKYIATDQGEVYTKVSELSIQFATDVTRALIDAINRVGEYPRHRK
ncbi:conserved hypothetical protein [Alkaliphilus metalliredigens QYMF]|uniref:Late competence development protein ComFB n=1 Tax=Alkaliphilus metalliredigens (strain QYMF) TaxID=293826 RepID=A6TR22_ALKMQ|nr:late competence development ComFB family protein [Alkaliphilus metalliredigens]ABR48640.1 conserved hypothetical protein [Alkaliphilus metalliredigens QYMF]